MRGRKAYQGPVRPASWQVSDTYRLTPRRTLDGTIEFKVVSKGKRGRKGKWFHFAAHVINPDKIINGQPAEWIDAIGEDGFHAFHPSEITETRKVRTR